MARWLYKIDFRDIITSYDNKEISVSELGIKVKERIEQTTLKIMKKVHPDCAEELEDILTDLEYIELINDFDNVLERLYDLGDTDMGIDNEWPPIRLFWVEPIS